jgi:hypothetical protein
MARNLTGKIKVSSYVYWKCLQHNNAGSTRLKGCVCRIVFECLTLDQRQRQRQRVR